MIGGELVLADLRMDSEPDYFFRFAAARHGSGWRAIPPRQRPTPRDAGALRRATWNRIREQPDTP